FNNAVMDNDEAAAAVPMRVSVFFGWPAMRRPARMPDSVFNAGRGCRIASDFLLERMDAPDRPGDGDGAIIERGNSTRIVPTVFQPFQTVDQYGNRIPPSDIPNNSTHADFS